MTAAEAKNIIKKLGLKQKEFSFMLGHNINYVTDLKRHGVSKHLEVILNLCDVLIDMGYEKQKIIAILKDKKEKI